MLKLAEEPQPKPTGSGSPLLKESDTSYHDWIELRRGDTTPADRERAIARRRALLDRLVQRSDPAEHVPDRAGEVDLEAAIHALDHDRRAAFVLTQVAGLSYAEAAEVCEVPVGTIRSRVARARADLLDVLAGDESGSGTAPG